MRAISKALPKQPRKGVHFGAMPFPDVPTFMARLSAMDESIGRLALRFTILTAARSGETRGMTWGEVDLSEGVWTIPADRMKAGQAHSVPLSEPALEILKHLAGLIGGRKCDVVFPGLKGQPLSDMTLSKALRGGGGGEYTVHGFRSSFRDWAAEKLPTVPGAVVEAALSHSVPNKVEAPYRRTKFLEQRRDLMARWASYAGGQSNVIALAGHRA